MRIITGIARGTKLETLDSDATRPTSDKVKEAIFSMIQFEIEGRRVLDLFGGSGQLALEALSRGAARATIIDESRDAVNLIIGNAKHAKLYDKCRISAISASAFLRGFNDSEKFNIVFLDQAANKVPLNHRHIRGLKQRVKFYKLPFRHSFIAQNR